MTFFERHFLGLAKKIIFRHEFLKRACLFFVVQKPMTWLFGPPFTRSDKIIAIDITYICNLRCINCVRSCRQAPSGQMMTSAQIRKFIKESVDNGIKWEKIRLMGGEPTLHPDILEFLQILLGYKKEYSQGTIIEVVTNGYGDKVAGVLSKIPKEVEISNSSKKSAFQEKFLAFNIAPIDLLYYKFADYSAGCRGMTVCGMGLTPSGYYHCAVGGGIDRVFGFDIGMKKMPLKDDTMIGQRKALCRYCGRFRGMGGWVKKEIFSPSWKEAYSRYKIKKPALSPY